MNDSVTFNAVTVFCHPPHPPSSSRTFPSLQKEALCPLVVTPAPAPGNQQSARLCGFVCSHFHQWDPETCGLWCRASVAQHHVSEVPPHRRHLVSCFCCWFNAGETLPHHCHRGQLCRLRPWGQPAPLRKMN